MVARVFSTEKLGKQSGCARSRTCRRQLRTLETCHLLIDLLLLAKDIYWLGDQRQTIETIRNFLADFIEGGLVKQRRRRPSAGWESLTPTELEVVRAVGTGLTNRQIATLLYVSPRSIQTHISNTFSKLGMTSRAEIAAEAARRLPAD